MPVMRPDILLKAIMHGANPCSHKYFIKERLYMLFISILMAVWFVLWLFFTYQNHQMTGIITSILIDFDKRQTKETKENDSDS